MRSRPAPKFKSLQVVLRSRVFTVIGLTAVVVVGIAAAKEAIRQIEVRRQIAGLEHDIVALERDNANLEDLIAYFNSSSFQEKQARQKLGLKKAGETVVVIPQADTAASTGLVSDSTTVATGTSSESNIIKWQQYFFH
ncbi:MAG: septum formation initiator family protein [Candidatus Kerfeldbacteria bacterium]|nr:septum formation initiator family protein [Candidatus Kerfeldbacteria bacterium]